MERCGGKVFARVCCWDNFSHARCSFFLSCYVNAQLGVNAGPCIGKLFGIPCGLLRALLLEVVGMLGCRALHGPLPDSLLGSGDPSCLGTPVLKLLTWVATASSATLALNFWKGMFASSSITSMKQPFANAYATSLCASSIRSACFIIWVLTSSSDLPVPAFVGFG